MGILITGTSSVVLSAPIEIVWGTPAAKSDIKIERAEETLYNIIFYLLEEGEIEYIDEQIMDDEVMVRFKMRYKVSVSKNRLFSNIGEGFSGLTPMDYYILEDDIEYIELLEDIGVDVTKRQFARFVSDNYYDEISIGLWEGA